MKHRVSWGGILLLAGIFAAAAVILYTQSYKSSQDPDELWPEQGDVIATIDGRGIPPRPGLSLSTDGVLVPQKSIANLR